METSAVEEIDADDIVGNPRRVHWYWTAGAAAAALLLLVQVVHHSRHLLVAQEWAQPALTAVYSMFGVTLEPAGTCPPMTCASLEGKPLLNPRITSWCVPPSTTAPPTASPCP